MIVNPWDFADMFGLDDPGEAYEVYREASRMRRSKAHRSAHLACGLRDIGWPEERVYEAVALLAEGYADATG